MKRYRAILLSVLILGCVAIVFLFADKKAARKAVQHSQESLTLWLEQSQQPAQLLERLRTAQHSEYEAEQAEKREALMIAPFTVDFEYWKSQNSKICGYIFSEDSPIDYPIVQGSDNSYYLDHDIYGHSDINGSIMMEYMNHSDFSDNNTILYGHHMKNGSMFASLDRYKDASYYADHAHMYLFTPEQNYRLDLIAGFPCPHDDPVFRLNFTADHIKGFMARSTFVTNLEDLEGPYVTLCTCSYEHDNWRYVVICKMVPIE